MKRGTEDLTVDWVVQMEEEGFLTTDDIADLMQRYEQAETAAIAEDNTGPFYDLVKAYHDSEHTDGANFRTVFGAMLVFAREADPALETEILDTFFPCLTHYVDSVSILSGMSVAAQREIGVTTPDQREKYMRDSFYSRVSPFFGEFSMTDGQQFLM